MLIWSYLAASPVKSEAKVSLKNWLSNWSWGVRMKTLLVFNIKNSSVVCKFLNSLLTLSSLSLPTGWPWEATRPSIISSKVSFNLSKYQGKILYGFLFSIAAAFYSAQLSYDVVCHHRNDLTKQCTVQCSALLLLKALREIIRSCGSLQPKWLRFVWRSPGVCLYDVWG